jgi:exosome complex component RRP42
MATATTSAPPLSLLNPSKSSQVIQNWQNATLLSASELTYIREGCRDNVRLDGRTRTELREYTLLQNDPLALSNGSARILWTGGHVLCSCKAELVKPSPLHPSQGLVELHVDLLQNQQRDTEEYLTSTLSKLLVSSVVHLGKLCVVPSLYVWRLAVDVVVLDDSGGSVLDACSRVIRAALLNTRLPHVVPTHGTSKQSSQQEQQGGGGAQVDLNVDGDMCNAVSVPGVEDCPIVVTVYVVKCPPKNATALVVDATLEEEACASCQVRVAVDPSGDVCALHNQGPLDASLLADILSTAVQASNTIFQRDQVVIKDEVKSQAETTTTLLQGQFLFR